MNINLITMVQAEEQIAIKKWGHADRTLNGLLAALLEESGEVAHAINHEEGIDQINQEIVETIGILSRLYNMVNGCVPPLPSADFKHGPEKIRDQQVR